MESLVFTMRLIRKRPLGLLTILQIALGVWIVAAILTMNFQAQDRIEATMDKFGENMMQIYLQREIPMGEHYAYEGGAIYREDLERLKQESENIEAVFTLDNVWYIRLQAHGLEYQLRGLTETSADAISALNLKIVEGYAFTKQDEDQGNRVALISTEISNQLFPNESPIGKTVSIGSEFDQEYLTLKSLEYSSR